MRRPGPGDDDVAAVEHLAAGLRLAVVLTADRDAAASLVVDSVRGRARSIARSDDPAGASRRWVVRRFCARRGPGPAPTGDRLLTTYGSLPRIDQVVVALRAVEHLPTAEIAATTDLTGPRVERLLHRSWSRLGPESDVSTALSVRLELATPELAATTLCDRAGDVATARRSHRRRRRRLTVAAIVSLLAAAVVVPTVVVPRLPVPVRPAGHWGTVVQTAHHSGWQVLRRVVTAQQEVASISRTSRALDQTAGTATAGGADDPNACSVQVSDGDRLSSHPDHRREISVDGRPGYLLGSDTRPELAAVWVYSGHRDTGAVAEIDCGSLAGATDQDVLDAAASIRFSAAELSLPFTIDRAPEHFAPGWVITSADGVDVTYTSTEDRWSFVTITISLDHSTGSVREHQTTRTTINGRTAYVSQDRDDTGLPQYCLMADRGRICVKAYWTAGDWTTRHQMDGNLDAVMSDTAHRLQPSPDLADPSTWSDAQPVLG